MCNHDDIKLRKIIDLASIRNNAKILDVGTGTGILVSYLLEKSPLKITAIDISKNMIMVAKEKYKDNRVEFIVKDVMEFNDKGFDYIFIYSAYPHFNDKEALFKHLLDRLNDGGKIIIAHSESKEKINQIHSKKDVVKDDVLEPAEVTTKIMSKYFKIDNVIDNEEMYYISAFRERFLVYP
ncbi:methyltransferase domain-containing protein, partial [Clostridium perfringens]|nr:methyltransferase domain-containing protein [Clostridium perfringens]